MVFRQGLLTPPAPDNGPEPTPDQVQAMVDSFQKAAKTSLPISVVNSPSEIDGIPVNVAPGCIPTGGVVGGRIYRFTDNLRACGELLVTIFHELFHYGLQNVVPAEQYVALMRYVASNSMVKNYIALWNAPTAQFKRMGARG